MSIIFLFCNGVFTKKAMLLFIVTSLFLFFGCSDQTSSSSLIIIDTSRDYPESNLKLSDVAQVTYVPLKYGKDSTIFSNPGSLAVAVFHDTLFILNRRVPYFAQILLYDMLGNPLSKIDRQGSGPGEYITLGNFILDTLRREIYGWDRESKKMLVYDFKGNCLREKYFDNGYYDMVNISPDYLLGYNDNSQYMSMFKENRLVRTKKKTITFINKKDFTEQVSGFDYAKPMINGTQCIVGNHTFTKDGLYITCDRSDTVYFLDRHLKLIPRIVDITPHSAKRESMIKPIIETERYIFISKQYRWQYGLGKGVAAKRPDFYVYDKAKKKLFRLKKDQKMEDPFLLVNNYIAIHQYMITQNHNYIATYLDPLKLLDNYKTLPPELKSITETLKEGDNPVVMLIKFK
ncbi:MAG: 6-bladed beta-propeller [Bacteroidales bacterium]